jgi:chromosomal replication initiator protein
MNYQELWQTVLAQLQTSLSPASFTTWFKNTKIFAFENGTLIISVPNSFVKEWLEQKYSKTILKIINQLEQGIKEIKFEIKKKRKKQNRKKE